MKLEGFSELHIVRAFFLKLFKQSFVKVIEASNSYNTGDELKTDNSRLRLRISFSRQCVFGILMDTCTKQ